MLHQRPGRRQGVIAAGTDGQHAAVGLDDLARAGNQQKVIFIGAQEHGLQLSRPVGLPFLGQLHGGTGQVSGELGELFFEFFGKGKGVRYGTGEARDHLAAVDSAHLFGGALHDDAFPHGHLTVSGHGGDAVAPHGADGGCLEHVYHLCMLKNHIP